MSTSLLRNVLSRAIVPFPVQFQIRNKFKNLDHSRVPVLNEGDLDVQYVRGSGPGGQAVNKTSNCVVLRHIPTNTIVKCHIHRSAPQNLKEAKAILITKLDNLANGDLSIEAQKKAIERKKLSDKVRKQGKLREMKKKWKDEISSKDE